jgi:hypothetical protein
MALLETYVDPAFWLAKRVWIIVVEGRVLVWGKGLRLLILSLTG